MANPRFNREALTDAQRDIATWPGVDVNVLPPEKQPLYTRRFNAVRDYLAGATYGAIRRAYDISPTRLWELVQRCLDKHPDGRLYGARALVPGVRTKPYQRRAEIKVQPCGSRGGYSGALGRLFDRFPELKEHIDDLFLKRRKPGLVHEPRIAIKHLHKRFIDKCRALGIKQDYPFTTKWLGKRALHNYLAQLAAKSADETVCARYGRNAARKWEATGEGAASEATRPFQFVQCDGHRIDGMFTIRVPHPTLGEVPVELPRIWLLVIKDVFSRAILGYVIALALEYGADDVAQCIQNAVVPWTPRKLTIPGLHYPERGGFPSGVLPHAQWVVWDDFWYDNAKAHLADITLDLLLERLHCRPHAGAIDAIERRAILERFFLTFEENGIHRLVSTTGSHPNDARRDNPQEKALKFDVRLEHLEELVDVMLAQFNATPHTALGFRTPLEVIEYYFAAGGEVRRLDEKDRDATEFLVHRDVRTVRGNIKKSRRPYIEYENAVYRNEVLSRSPHLIGARLTLHVNRRDLRCIKAFLPNGAELGVLTAQHGWGRTPHSLDTRRAIGSLRNRKLMTLIEMDDPVALYHEHLGRESLTKKRARPRFEKTRREAAATPPAPSAPTAPAVSSARKAPNRPHAAPRKTVTY